MSATVVSAAAVDIPSSAPRRKSGRVIKKPELFAASSPAGSAKRKRRQSDNDQNAADSNSEEEDLEESSEGEPDEEELREKRRKTKNRSGRKPAPKKPKTNGETMSLAIRPAKSKNSKPKKPRKALARKSALVEDAEGLYAEVFARGNNLEDVAAQWVHNFQQDEAQAVADVVNFVLRAAGCHIKIDENDIADPDNCPNRLGEIQEEYQAENVADYPLITRSRGSAAFKNALHGFFVALIETIAQSGLLYENTELIENIQVWISTMSSAPNRPFRHTSTVASLAVTSALSKVANDIVENTAKKMRQSESEAKKSRVNKARVAAVNKEIEELNQKLEIVDAAIGDWFDTVYVHRYRDVDPKIRVECVEALSDWISIYPDKFFDGVHLRYLGWILSDPSYPTRVEVLKQLQKLFRSKDKLAGLKTFTERFRSRIVEMATRDAETSVRAAAVELLDILREAGFLEPNDIDSVGKLIFDAEPKVRKAVVGFFAENVTSAYELQIEDMGGQEALDEALVPTEGDDDHENPRLEWLKLKCLIEQLLAYDEEDGELPSQIERIPPSGAELGLVAAGIESRFSLAAQALYDAIPEIRAWEILAGYLLYDHSQTIENGGGDDVELLLRQNCKLDEKQETALLDILNAAVRLRLQRLAETSKDKKKTKAQREADKDEQAETAQKLSVLIPQLLKKFGALPEAASLCLRLERELNLDVFQELRQNAALTALLDDINKQFLTHHNERVLNEAIESILHAQGHEDSKELTALKVQALWDDLINTFDVLRRGKDFSVRGNLEQNTLTGVSNIVLKIAELAKVSDPAVLDQIPSAPATARGKSKKGAQNTTPPIKSLLQILDRGVPAAHVDAEVEIAEDTLVRHTMTSLLFYFMWKCRDCATHIEAGTSIPDDELTAIAERRDACVMAVMRIMESRKGADELRIEAAYLLLDLYDMFHTLKKIKAQPSPNKTPKKQARAPNSDWEALCQEIDDPTTKILLQILTAAETNFAKRTKKHIDEGTNIDDDPIDPDDDPESSDSDDDQEEEEAAAADERHLEDKMLRSLLAEERLCSLGGRIVRAVLVGTLDGPHSRSKTTVRAHLERNKTKLGPHWKEVVAHLDIAKTTKSKARKKAVGAAAAAAKESAKPQKSREIVVEEDSDEEEDEEEEEEEEREEDGDPQADHDDDDVGDDANEEGGIEITDAIQDEDMPDAEEDHVNGDDYAAPGLASPDVESVLGD